ncbi:hypothetical protein K469DRAFT_685352 [Zopfia rhizophila CBS 207.26]|uniref:Uncharacterized protein n=1 Tax=Zopfia rhizophila CBS 207.26 TaxID=1314779 RepID=A0A6A6E895_9PEZI|nr:hypothetical protein K469DRAFT_685352 [Zopfia rhizophila CBS 207.26]
MGMDECIGTYTDLVSTVFGEKLSRIPVNMKGKSSRGSTQRNWRVRFNRWWYTVAHPRQSCLMTELSVNVEPDRDTKDMIRLRSYSLPDEPNIPATICQAALTTSAATEGAKWGVSSVLIDF